MKTNGEYQEEVERKFGKPLKEIMYDLCVIKDLTPYPGAEVLEVPRTTFIAWRNKFRFGPQQFRCDNAKKSSSETVNIKKELKDADIMRAFLINDDDKSLRGFKELVERYVELCKMQEVQPGVDTYTTGIYSFVNVHILNRILALLDDYCKGDAQKKYLHLAENITGYKQGFTFMP